MATPESITQQYPEQEEWRPVIGFDGGYEVSNCGRVRSPLNGGRILKGWFRHNHSDYPSVSLCQEGKRRTVYVHHLVATAFLGPRPEKYEVNHIDGTKTNNHFSNLEYLTKGGNLKHAYSLGLHWATMSKAKLKESDVLAIRRMLLDGKSYTEILNEINRAIPHPISRQAISSIKCGTTWKHIQLDSGEGEPL